MADPAYRRIADSLRREVETGILLAGDQLPTEQELAETWGASRSTVREAIRLLVTRGLVEARPGQGTFVTRKITPIVTDLSATHDLGTGETAQYYIDVRRQHRTPHSTSPKVVIEPANAAVAAELQLAPGAQVVCRHQLRFVDDEPYSLQTSFYPMQLVSDRGARRLIEAGDVAEGTIQYLRSELGIDQVGYRDVITVRTPDATETAFFRLPEDGRVAVFENFRTSYDQDGHPIRVTVTVYPADRNQFVISVAPDG
ncbi:MAG TPA: GntR family transcriptional regulator [Streptosporangiaceae bacterium]|jgi:GntR family transcriptional regulator|nr:GntR family transcriptional regulator [Streptosporangiaceae bacterium]